jgi:hypothetical protein
MAAPKKRVPLGKPLQLTDEQLDQLAIVTPADIEKAKVFWRNNVPAEFETLLDAETIEEDEA